MVSFNPNPWIDEHNTCRPAQKQNDHTGVALTRPLVMASSQSAVSRSPHPGSSPSSSPSSPQRSSATPSFHPLHHPFLFPLLLPCPHRRHPILRVSMTGPHPTSAPSTTPTPTAATARTSGRYPPRPLWAQACLSSGSALEACLTLISSSAPPVARRNSPDSVPRDHCLTRSHCHRRSRSRSRSRCCCHCCCHCRRRR